MTGAVRRKRQFAAMGALALLLMAPAVEAQVSQKFRESLSAASDSMGKGDIAGANGRLASLQPASPLETYMLASFQLELAARRGDVRGQHKAASDMLSSGLAPQGQQGFLHHIMGYAAFQGGALDQAIDQLTTAQKLGYAKPDSALLLAESWMRKRKPANALPVISALIDQQTTSGQAVPVAWLDRASAVAEASRDWPAYARFQSMRLRAGATPGDWRTAIATYLAGAAPEPEMQLDLMRLQAATGSLASERDYQSYAVLASKLGRAAEAKSVIETGRSDGSLALADTVTTPLFNSMSAKARQNLVSVGALTGKSAGVKSALAASDAADQLLSAGQYAEAASYYRAALARGPADANRTNARLGMALARSGDIAGAQAAYAKVGGKWSDIAAFWSGWAAAQGSPATSPVVSSTPAVVPPKK